MLSKKSKNPELAFDLEELGRGAKATSKLLGTVTTAQKNDALRHIARLLEENLDEILLANQKDIKNAQETGKPSHYIDRLSLDQKRVFSLVNTVNEIAKYDDPIGSVVESFVRPNGLRIQKVRVPLGVVGVIFESRPDVTIDIASICIKSGNAAILRGGSDVLNTNSALVSICKEGLSLAKLPQSSVQLIVSSDRALVNRMLKLDKYIDLIVPRGSSELVNLVAREAKMHSIFGGYGVSHIYIDQTADLKKAKKIVVNSKTDRPSVCNALDTVLIDQVLVERFLQEVVTLLTDAGVEVRIEERYIDLLKSSPLVVAAKGEDFGTEFLGFIVSIKVVSGVDEACEHVARFGGHTDGIVAEDKKVVDRFVSLVDSAAVVVNASTRFNDGGQLGLGGEVAVSTSKFHARGPVGMKDMCSYKWVVRGEGQIRT